MASSWKTQQGADAVSAAACKVGDERVLARKSLCQAAVLCGQRPRDDRARRLGSKNLINYSHQEDNKPDVVIAHGAQKDAQEQMRSQLGDCVAVSWLSVCLALAGLIPFCNTSSSLLHICQGFSLGADGVCRHQASCSAFHFHTRLRQLQSKKGKKKHWGIDETLKIYLGLYRVTNQINQNQHTIKLKVYLSSQTKQNNYI